MKKSVVIKCIYNRLKKCRAKVKIVPKAQNLIYAKNKETEHRKRKVFFLRHDLPLDLADWEIVENSGTGEHIPFCRNQVPLSERTYDEEILRNGTSAEIKKEKAKYARFGQHSSTQRRFRKLLSDQAQDPNLKRPEINEKFHQWDKKQLSEITVVKIEKQASYYHEHKKRKIQS